MSYLGVEYWQWSVIACLPLIYWYLTRNFDYWVKRGIKGPKPLPFVGNFFSFSKPMHELRTERYKKYGKFYGLFSGHKPVLSIAEPELIKQILVKDFHLFRNRQQRKVEHPIVGKNLVAARDEQWKRVRSIASPTFTSGKMKKMYPLMVSCAKEFVDVLEDYAINEKEIDLKQMHGNFTMDVIAKCAFATTTNSHKDSENPFVKHAKNLFKLRLWKVAIIIMFPKFLLKLLNITTNSDEKSVDFFVDTTKYIIRKRRENKEKYNDLLQLLMDAEKGQQIRHENDVNESHHVNEGEEELEVEKEALSQSIGDKHLSENEILAQALIFFLAGYETTASTLSYCTYELALNPDIQEKLYEEIMTAFDSNGVIPYETLAKLPFLDAVISETLRKYPPAIILTREASTQYELANTGVTLFKDQTVEIPVYAIHHSEEYYPNPNQFKPERFLHENRDQIIPYTYLPFGAGPRNCIGMRFALMEAKLGLTSILQKYRFSRSPKTEVPLNFLKSLGLLQAKNISVRIHKR